MSNIKFRIAAKTDVGLVRTNNEDNFQASADLSDGHMRWVNNEICSLGDKGALIVVADGMGGMNAGEVASELAIETVKQFFTPDKLTPEVLKTRYTIEKYMNEAVVAADARIKAEAKSRPETRGMGTTIVIGWLLDGKLYVSWCGDSRAYVYNPSAGLHQISKDHSYVQNLVDKGSLTREEAFDFPDSNIITRCLSDGSTKAKPESLLKPYDVCDNDIILLCTDGLSGMIRDREIEAIIKANEHNMDTLVDELIKAACDAEGSDNITICLCQILQGGGTCNPEVFDEYDKRLNGNRDGVIRTLISKPEEFTRGSKRIWLIAAACLIAVIGCAALWWFCFRDGGKPTAPAAGTNLVATDTITHGTGTQEAASAEDAYQTGEADEGASGSGVNINVPAAGTAGNGSIFTGTGAGAPAQGEPAEAPGSEGELTLILPAGGEAPSVTDDDDTAPELEELDDYLVRKGDTYSKLAKNFKTTKQHLQELNNNTPLKAGETIKVPKKR